MRLHSERVTEPKSEKPKSILLSIQPASHKEGKEKLARFRGWLEGKQEAVSKVSLLIRPLEVRKACLLRQF